MPLDHETHEKQNGEVARESARMIANRIPTEYAEGHGFGLWPTKHTKHAKGRSCVRVERSDISHQREYRISEDSRRFAVSFYLDPPQAVVVVSRCKNSISEGMASTISSRHCS